MKWQEAKEILEDIMLRQEKLNDWELGFIESIQKRVESKTDLTDGQVIKLDEIYQKVCD